MRLIGSDIKRNKDDPFGRSIQDGGLVLLGEIPLLRRDRSLPPHRREGGFSYWEVLITLYLLTLLLSFLYPSITLLEQTEKGSRIYAAVLLWADEETERWRRGLPFTAREKEIEGSIVRQNVESRGYEDGVEGALFRYEWMVGERPYNIDFEVEREWKDG